MKINRKAIAIVIILISTFVLGFGIGRDNGSGTNSRIYLRTEAKVFKGDWGEMDIYTKENTTTYGTERMFTALTDVLPGKSVHPSHRHGEEEFLLISRGEGIWVLEGDTIRQSPATCYMPIPGISMDW